MNEAAMNFYIKQNLIIMTFSVTSLCTSLIKFGLVIKNNCLGLGIIRKKANDNLKY